MLKVELEYWSFLTRYDCLVFKEVLNREGLILEMKDAKLLNKLFMRRPFRDTMIKALIESGALE